MQTYLLSAAAVIFLSVIVSLVVPEGKLNKTVTFVMRLVCIFVLIQPLTKLFNIPGLDNSANADLTDYEYVRAEYSENQSAQLKKLVDRKFEIETDCLVEVEYADGKFKVGEVRVTLAKKDSGLIEEIYEYLGELGYINITVYAEST